MAANLDGINPAIRVNDILMSISIKPATGGNVARFETPNKSYKNRLIGIFNRTVIKIPKIPLVNPIIKVSALKTREISFLLAPILRKIPISLVLSNTEIYVIIPIIIEDTIKDTLTKAIKT